MNQTARVLSLLLGLLIGAGPLAPALVQAAERGMPQGIVLAQVDPPTQTEPRKRKGIFRFLFRNRDRERQQQQQQLVPRREMRLVPRREANPVQREQPRKQTRPRKQSQDAEKPAKPRKERKQRKSRPAAAAAPRQAEPVEKAPDAKRVLVMGDFLSTALAKGLTEAFAQNADVVVVDGSKGDSGLVRADNYDWAAEIPAAMEAHKPDALLMLVGANDRQSITTDAGSQPLGGELWRLAYGARASALADALKATAKPVLWAGLPPVKPSAMSRDYSTLNGIFREQLEARGMRYVDVWNGFADENGKFVSTGPDVNGQTVQLRDSDGVNFTRAGQRKLAFFVERELNDALGAAQPLLAAATATQPANIEQPDQAPRIGPMIPLDALAVAGDTLSAVAAPADPQQGAVATTISNRLVGDPNIAPPPGRADDFAWPPRPLPAAAPQAGPPAPALAPVATPPVAPTPLAQAQSPEASAAPAPVLVVPATVQPVTAPAVTP